MAVEPARLEECCRLPRRLHGEIYLFRAFGTGADLPFVCISANLYNRLRERPDVLTKIRDVAMEVGLCGG